MRLPRRWQDPRTPDTGKAERITKGGLVAVQPGDVVVLLGAGRQLDAAQALLAAGAS